MQATITRRNIPPSIAHAALGLALVIGAGEAAAATTLPPLVVREQGYFFVNHQYFTSTSGEEFIANESYVEYQIPVAKRHPYPLIFIPGGGQTGTNYTGTPDGRPGWTQFFLSKGYAVYVVDLVGRGKAAWSVDLYGTPGGAGRYTNVENRFTNFGPLNLWPQAHLHTQWPGAGVHGDPIFDQFLASQVPSTDPVAQELLQQSSISELLDRIGPAILVTHSQSGTYGWQIADARPQLVKGIIALEPYGPPFHDSIQIGPPAWFEDDPATPRPWGVTRNPITYSPAITDPAALNPVREATADAPDKVRCWLQSEPAHQLPNLQGIPILIVASGAGYHATYDHCTSKYLTQAGVENTVVVLSEVGIHGNGHMMMIEKNNLDIAAWLDGWIRSNVE